MTDFPQRLQVVSATVETSTIEDYAELTDDRNPIHLDVEFARMTPMGGVIAHGTYSLNLIVHSLETSLGEGRLANLDLDVRFTHPVRPRDFLTAGGNLTEPGTYFVFVANGTGQLVVEGKAILR